MKVLKVKEILKMLTDDGWYKLKSKATNGSHRHFKHPTKPGKVTVNGKPSDDVHIDDQRSIFNQAGWEWK